MRPFEPVFYGTAKTKQVVMENSKIPYVCGICGKKFHTLTSLGKHVELRHPTFAKISSISSKISIETQTNSSNDHQENLLLTKRGNGNDDIFEKLTANGTSSVERSSTSPKISIETKTNFCSIYFVIFL